LQVSGNKLQQVDKFKYFKVVFASDGGQNKKIDKPIGEANAVLSEFYHSVFANRELSIQTPQSCQFLNQSWFRSSPMSMNLG